MVSLSVLATVKENLANGNLSHHKRSLGGSMPPLKPADDLHAMSDFMGYIESFEAAQWLGSDAFDDIKVRM